MGIIDMDRIVLYKLKVRMKSDQLIQELFFYKQNYVSPRLLKKLFESLENSTVFKL
jgi:hypothetical protein